MTRTKSTILPTFRSEQGRARYAAAYAAAVGDWPVAQVELDIPTRLGPTHVIASGPPDAPPLVLLPSFAGTAVAWRLNIEALSRDFRTYAVDVVGQPGLSVAHQRLRNRVQYGSWLVEVLDGLGVERASMVGCSFGGFLALNQALLTPERVDRVVLISPAGTFASQYWSLFWTMRIKAPALKLARRLLGRGRLAGLADPRGKAASFVPPSDRRWSALMAVTMAEAPKVSVMSPTVFSNAQLRSIRAPTLLLIGDQERLYEPHAALRLARGRMPRLETAIVPDAGHIAAMAQPDDVNGRIIRFLRAGPGQADEARGAD